MSLNRNGREFVGVWRGGREFTELRRGERVLWQKEVPEVQHERLEQLHVTAASAADLALLDFVLWLIELGYPGRVTATLAGEVHSLAGSEPLLTVRSEVVANDGCSAVLAVGEESKLHADSLRAGDAVRVQLVVADKGTEWLPKELSDDRLTVVLPCLLPDGEWARLSAFQSEWDGVWRYSEVLLNDVCLGEIMCGAYVFGNSDLELAFLYELKPQQINKVLSETTERPLRLVFEPIPTKAFMADGTGIKVGWNVIDTVITLIVKNANENML